MHTIKEDELATYLCCKDSYVFGVRDHMIGMSTEAFSSVLFVGSEIEVSGGWALF